MTERENAGSGPVVSAQQIEVTLLGTGSPRPIIDRFGPSTLVQAGDQILIFDAGRGAMQRLNQMGITFAQLDAVFLTHLHSDHIVGLPDLWLTGWLDGRRDKPIKIFGPIDTSHMMEHLIQAFDFDIHIRIEDDKCSPAGVKVQVTEVQEGVIYDRSGVRVTAFEVDHRPVSPAFGYRIDYAGRSVVLSGDTRFSTNLIQFADRVDLLVHEVADASDKVLEKHPGIARAFAHHVNAREAGEIFRRTKPKLAVYSHIILAGIDIPGLLSLTRSKYSGPLMVGEDLTKFVVGDDITVHRL